MAANIMENGKTIIAMDLAFSKMKMDMSMMENGKTIKSMEKGKQGQRDERQYTRPCLN